VDKDKTILAQTITEEDGNHPVSNDTSPPAP